LVGIRCKDDMEDDHQALAGILLLAYVSLRKEPFFFAIVSAVVLAVHFFRSRIVLPSVASSVVSARLAEMTANPRKAAAKPKEEEKAAASPAASPAESHHEDYLPLPPRNDGLAPMSSDVRQRLQKKLASELFAK